MSVKTFAEVCLMRAGSHFNMNICHLANKGNPIVEIVVRSSYFHNGIYCTGKTASEY